MRHCTRWEPCCPFRLGNCPAEGLLPWQLTLKSRSSTAWAKVCSPPIADPMRMPQRALLMSFSSGPSAGSPASCSACSRRGWLDTAAADSTHHIVQHGMSGKDVCGPCQGCQCFCLMSGHAAPAAGLTVASSFADHSSLTGCLNRGGINHLACLFAWHLTCCLRQRRLSASSIEPPASTGPQSHHSTTVAAAQYSTGHAWPPRTRSASCLSPEGALADLLLRGKHDALVCIHDPQPPTPRGLTSAPSWLRACWQLSSTAHC